MEASRKRQRKAGVDEDILGRGSNMHTSLEREHWSFVGPKVVQHGYSII